MRTNDGDYLTRELSPRMALTARSKFSTKKSKND